MTLLWWWVRCKLLPLPLRVCGGVDSAGSGGCGIFGEALSFLALREIAPRSPAHK
jgi:hypothetical protein